MEFHLVNFQWLLKNAKHIKDVSSPSSKSNFLPQYQYIIELTSNKIKENHQLKDCLQGLMFHQILISDIKRTVMLVVKRIYI